MTRIRIRQQTTNSTATILIMKLTAKNGRATISVPRKLFQLSIRRRIRPKLHRRLNYRNKIINFQACPADEHAVDVRPTHQVRGVVRLDRAAIQDASLLAQLPVV